MPALPNGTRHGEPEEATEGPAEATAPGLLRGLRELGNALFRAGAEGVPLAGTLRVHRALPLTAMALLLSVAVAGTVALTTLAGAWLSSLRLRSGSLAAPVLAHTASNAVPVLVARAVQWRQRRRARVEGSGADGSGEAPASLP